MAVEFTANGQGIRFGNQANGLTTYSISIWYFADTDGFVAEGGVLVNGGDTTLPAGHPWGAFDLLISDGFGSASNSGDILFVQAFDGSSAGQWYTTATPSFSAWHHLIIAYDNRNTANNPIYYIDGAPVAITEEFAPVGTAITTSDVLGIGYLAAASSYTHDGKIQDPRLYNRLLSAQEASILAKSRNMNVVLGGLVFNPLLIGAAGLQTFDGATLAAGNTVIDRISGVAGVLSGNPIGRGNTIQTISGLRTG